MKLYLPLFFLYLIGCASYQTKLSIPMKHMQAGEAAKAAELLKEAAYKPSRDQLVFALDYSLAAQTAGNYKESNKGFQLAYELADWNDYHSVTKIAGSLLVNEGLMQYKGDEYEKLLIPVYAAKNFILQNDFTAARVEVKRIHERINAMQMDGEKVFKQMPYAYYLSALVWELNGNLDSAYIDYKKTFELAPEFTEVKHDLLRLSKRLGRTQEAAKFKKKFSDLEMQNIGRNSGQLVLIYEQGRAPRKFPHPNWHRIPKLYPVKVAGVQARLTVKGKDISKDTTTVLNINELAIETLDKQYAGLIAKRMAAIATKAVVAEQVRQRNEGLGQLAWIAMNVADQADLRQWLFLPASVQVAKVYLPAGKYQVSADALTNAKVPLANTRSYEVEVKANKISFINYRSFN